MKHKGIAGRINKPCALRKYRFARPAQQSHIFFDCSNDMDPDRALNEQIVRYRRMTGEQRLRIALELHELSCNVAREGIRRQNPNADEAEVEHLLRRRLELARQ